MKAVNSNLINISLKTIEPDESEKEIARTSVEEPLPSYGGPAKSASETGASKTRNSETPHCEYLVERYLEGRALQDDQLTLLRNHRALLRCDHESLCEKVRLMSGGPLGAEPLFSGCIGQGMLDGAVLGELTSAPPRASVLATLRVLARSAGDGGVLAVVHGDPASRLNFGLACQQAAHEGVKTLCVTVNDDCSCWHVRYASCGIAFLWKIAGAMADEGRSIYEIVCVLRALRGRALATVRVPSGASVTEVVSDALFCLFSPHSERSLFVGVNDQVAVLVSDLGNVSEIRRTLFVRELLARTRALGVTVSRLYVGKLTDPAREGFSVSVLRATAATLERLGRPSAARGWPTGTSLGPFADRCLFYVDATSDNSESVGPRFTVGEARLVVDILTEVIGAWSQMRDYLDALDGDAAFGAEAAKFTLELGHRLESRALHVLTPYGVLQELSRAAAAMGGRAGPAFDAAFSSAAQAFVASSSREPVALRHWIGAAAMARDAVAGLAPDARPGVLDALGPFAGAFDAPASRRLSAAVRAAVAGAEEAADPAAYAIAVALRIAFERYRSYRMEMEASETKSSDMLMIDEGR